MITSESQLVKDALANLRLALTMVQTAFVSLRRNPGQNPECLVRLRFASPIDDHEPHVRRTCEVRASVSDRGVPMFSVNLDTVPPDLAHALLRTVNGRLSSEVPGLLELTVEMSDTTLTFEVELSPGDD